MSDIRWPFLRDGLRITSSSFHHLPLFMVSVRESPSSSCCFCPDVSPLKADWSKPAFFINRLAMRLSSQGPMSLNTHFRTQRTMMMVSMVERNFSTICSLLKFYEFRPPRAP